MQRIVRNATTVWIAALLLVGGLSSGCCVNRAACGPSGCSDGCGSYGGRSVFSGIAGCLRNSATCGAGCGSLYVDEWISDPPDCCDPCDDCGNYVGPRYGAPRVGRLLGALWGCRYCGGCEAGCDHCNYADEGIIHEHSGHVIHEGFAPGHVQRSGVPHAAPPQTAQRGVVVRSASHQQQVTPTRKLPPQASFPGRQRRLQQAGTTR